MYKYSNIVLEKGTKIAITSNQGIYLLELVKDLEQYRVKDIFNSEFFQSIQILKGIEVMSAPFKKVDIYFRSSFNLSDIDISYQRYDWNDKIQAIIFNPKKADSIIFQKNLLLDYMVNLDSSDISKLPMNNIRKIAKLLKA